jgi:hypothetical protein
MEKPGILFSTSLQNHPMQLTTEAAFMETPVCFPIKFAFNNRIYQAQVYPRDTTVMEYLVTDVQPEIPYLPFPYVIAANLRRDLFDFPVNEEYYPVSLGKSVLAAIETACVVKGVPVFGNPSR